MHHDPFRDFCWWIQSCKSCNSSILSWAIWAFLQVRCYISHVGIKSQACPLNITPFTLVFSWHLGYARSWTNGSVHYGHLNDSSVFFILKQTFAMRGIMAQPCRFMAFAWWFMGVGKVRVKTHAQYETDVWKHTHTFQTKMVRFQCARHDSAHGSDLRATKWERLRTKNLVFLKNGWSNLKDKSKRSACCLYKCSCYE